MNYGQACRAGVGLASYGRLRRCDPHINSASLRERAGRSGLVSVCECVRARACVCVRVRVSAGTESTRPRPVTAAAEAALSLPARRATTSDSVLPTGVALRAPGGVRRGSRARDSLIMGTNCRQAFCAVHRINNVAPRSAG